MKEMDKLLETAKQQFRKDADRAIKSMQFDSPIVRLTRAAVKFRELNGNAAHYSS